MKDNRDARLGVDAYDNKIRFGVHTRHTRHVYEGSKLDPKMHPLPSQVAEEIEAMGRRTESHATFFAGARAGIEAFNKAGSGEEWTKAVQKAWEKLK